LRERGLHGHKVGPPELKINEEKGVSSHQKFPRRSKFNKDLKQVGKLVRR
jgi:hypothetical protein